MTVAALNLRVDTDRGILVKSAADGSEYSIPALQQYDIVTLAVQALYTDPEGTINNPLLITDPTSYTTKVGLFDSTGTQLAFQNTFTVDSVTGTQSGVLDLSTAAIATLLATTNPVTNCILEIMLTDSLGNPRRYQATNVQLRKGYITTATVGVAPTETAASQSWALATFLPLAGTAGDYTSLIVKSATSGNRIRITWDDDGQPLTEKLT